jgi:hypothetical protein
MLVPGMEFSVSVDCDGRMADVMLAMCSGDVPRDSSTSPSMGQFTGFAERITPSAVEDDTFIRVRDEICIQTRTNIIKLPVEAAIYPDLSHFSSPTYPSVKLVRHFAAGEADRQEPLSPDVPEEENDVFLESDH